MVKKGGDDLLKALLWIAGGGLVLYGVKVAIDEQNTGTNVPADPGGRIDLVVRKLNEQFTKQWVTVGLAVLKAYLEKTLPKPVVGLVDVVYQVEQRSMYVPMTGPQKRQAAVQMARTLLLS